MASSNDDSPTDNRPAGDSPPQPDNAALYWRANSRLIICLLTIWATVSFGMSIFFVEQMNAIPISDWIPSFKLPLGFWFAQQGSIYVFVVLIFVYAFSMDRLDKKYGMKD